MNHVVTVIDTDQPKGEWLKGRISFQSRKTKNRSENEDGEMRNEGKWEETRKKWENI